ncbi:hypothetical protein [Paenibacillus arenosi]|uniref:Uncharacterized protein n=1 Tax=Paenibacillus arenosi TaxID=2774142 RepID=A0ABR9B1C2_9BACL|nr:hypothetical protein [Paenibacillus arenosi]MBD8499931.1 hypothetical protein [Paenibacillus arenosi]
MNDNDQKNNDSIEKRLHDIENQLSLQNKRGKMIRTAFFVILVLFLIFFLIGIAQFIKGGS